LKQKFDQQVPEDHFMSSSKAHQEFKSEVAVTIDIDCDYEIVGYFQDEFFKGVQLRQKPIQPSLKNQSSMTMI
jgi:hypothetical protein